MTGLQSNGLLFPQGFAIGFEPQSFKKVIPSHHFDDGFSS
jgi:hypothetical protein